jgi:ammonium transporter Rh
MFWPSFNGALADEGNQQQRIFVNTNLSIAAGCIGAAFTARLFYDKLEMTIIMNATLAGGVAIGTCSDIITSPAGSMLVGFAAGIFSAVGFNNIGPMLSNRINLQDTCGVLSLHGMPGLLGGIASLFAIAATAHNFEKGYYPVTAAGGSISGQVMAQVYMILVTFGFSLVSGYFTGLFCKANMFAPPQVLFKDDDHMENVTDRYPETFLDIQDGKRD